MEEGHRDLASGAQVARNSTKNVSDVMGKAFFQPKNGR